MLIEHFIETAKPTTKILNLHSFATSSTLSVHREIYLHSWRYGDVPNENKTTSLPLPYKQGKRERSKN